MEAVPAPQRENLSRMRGRLPIRGGTTRRLRSLSPAQRPTPQTYRTRNLHHSNVLIDNLRHLPPTIDEEVRKILGITSWEDVVTPVALLNDATEKYLHDSQDYARECSLEGDWKISLCELLKTLREIQAPGVLKVVASGKIWNHHLKPVPAYLHSLDRTRDNDYYAPAIPRSTQSPLPTFNPTDAMTTASAMFDGSVPSLPPFVSIAQTPTSLAAEPYYISTPKPDILVALAHGGFEIQHQHLLVDYQATSSIISDPHSADIGTRFPFLVVEAKGQSLNGSLVSAQNQAAVSAACMLNILRDLSNQEDGDAGSAAEGVSGTQKILTPMVCFSLVTAGPTHELAVHFVHEEAFQMYCFKTCRTTLRSDTRILVHFLHRILQWGYGRFKDDIVGKLDSLATN